MKSERLKDKIFLIAWHMTRTSIFGWDFWSWSARDTYVLFSLMCIDTGPRRVQGQGTTSSVWGTLRETNEDPGGYSRPAERRVNRRFKPEQHTEKSNWNDFFFTMQRFKVVTDSPVALLIQMWMHLVKILTHLSASLVRILPSTCEFAGPSYTSIHHFCWWPQGMHTWKESGNARKSDCFHARMQGEDFGLSCARIWEMATYPTLLASISHFSKIHALAGRVECAFSDSS